MEPAPAIVVDARGLEPPEPMVRVLSALDALKQGDRLLMRIHIEPRPLFRILTSNGYGYRCEFMPEGHFEVTIWKES
jgi:uncharacterized protein (DUF2249 family)